jgi:spermidine synthase
LKTVLVFFFLSGAAGLIYEIVWIRMLGLIFGHSVHAITTVLVAFMGGLALGSYLCGRVVDRVESLLKAYGLLEIGIGVYALLTPWLIELVKGAYLGIARSLELPVGVYTLIQFALSSLIILIPTMLMGSTLPLLARFAVRDLGAVGRGVGTLYAVNTFGAVLGTFLAGFELLPRVGMRSTLLIVACLNIAIGVMILLLDRRRDPLPVPHVHPMSPPSGEAPPLHSVITRNQARWLLIGFALSGAVSMVYEVAWTRALTLVIGSTTYAFTIMLLSFLVGIAGGSLLFARLTARGPLAPVWFGALQIAIAASAALVVPLIERLPDVFLRGYQWSHAQGFILWLQAALSIAVMVVPTLCIGATFPCMVQIFSANQSPIGPQVGRIYAFNTTGGIIGSFAAGFLFIPLIGVQPTIRTATAVNLMLGCALVIAFSVGRRPRLAAGFGLAIGLAAIALSPSWDHKIMSSGVAIYANLYTQEPAKWRERLEGQRLLYYKDGISATVSVSESEGVTGLRINGKMDASATSDPNAKSDMPTQLMAGHLPALLHPDPKRAFVIGLGSGVTVGALTQHALERIDVAELEPAVIEASAFFAAQNRNALSHPTVHVAASDGRNFLLTTEERYDLVVSEPSNPWIGGISTLFTVEFFDLVRRHMNENGVMVQWLHGYAMSPEDFRMIAASFRAVFPHATLWATNHADYLLVGTLNPMVVDLDRVRDTYAAIPELRRDMSQSKLVSPEGLLSAFYLDERELERLTLNADLNTDDLLPLEFSAPRNIYQDTIMPNYQALRAVKTSRFPPLRGARLETLDAPAVRVDLAIGYMAKAMYEEALDHLNDALVRDSRYTTAWVLRGWTHRVAGRFPEALQDLQAALRIDPSHAGAYHELGLLFLARKQPREAVTALQYAVELAPDNAEYVSDLLKAIREHPSQS